ncbi:MAG: hypothetical protein ACRDJE_03015, partial [Dehalococcoidia bacterium]
MRFPRQRYAPRLLAVGALTVAILVLAGLRAGQPVAGAQQATPEEQLAAKYAPIVFMKSQDEACDRGGDPYRPAPVEIVLGRPEFSLHDPDADGAPTTGPSAADLFQQGNDVYLDYPGSPARSGCTYEQDFETYGQGAPSVAYAHIAQEPGRDGLALQYWFYYYFNDWNDKHEGDWEMIQLVFDAGSAEEALGQDPVRVGYAQHGGGERAAWTDAKLQKEGDHPIVYVAGGSHPSHFQPEVYLGIGEAGQGFGCDHAEGPSRRIPLEARLVPDDITDPNDPYAWATFQGRWGEKQPALNNGPLGPNANKRWTQPFTHFDDDLYDSATVLPGRATFGPDAIDVFCRVVALSSPLVSLYYGYPVAALLIGGVTLLGAAVLVGGTARTNLFTSPARWKRRAGAPRFAFEELPIVSSSAVDIYRRHVRLFVTIGLVFIPIGMVAAIVQAWLTSASPLTPLLERMLDDHPVLYGILMLSLGGLASAVAFIFVNSAVAVALDDIRNGRMPAARRSYRAVRGRAGALARARLRAFGIVAVLSVTLIGIPWAIWQGIRWRFIEQAVMLDGAGSRDAPDASARVVRGHWWRTFRVSIVLGLVALLTGPVIATVFLLLFSASVGFVNLIGSLVYALLLPLNAIAFTQLYTDLRTTKQAPG